MNREIKFRQYLGKNHWHYFAFKEGICEGVASASLSVNPIMQFTGLKDKNGKEIYESDILRVIDPQVQKPDDSLMVVNWSTKFAGFVVNRKGWMFSHFFGEAIDGLDVEVAGNIYSDPHLLEGTTKQRSMNNAEEPAFPIKGNFIDGHTGIRTSVDATGMTKREYFAAMAMQGILQSVYGDSQVYKIQLEDWMRMYGDITVKEAAAKDAVLHADALLAELSKAKS